MTLNNFLEGNSKINYQEMADGHPTVMKLYAENARLKTKINAAYTVARGEGIDLKKIGNNVWEFIKKIWNAIKNAYKWIVDKLSKMVSYISKGIKYIARAIGIKKKIKVPDTAYLMMDMIASKKDLTSLSAGLTLNKMFAGFADILGPSEKVNKSYRSMLEDINAKNEGLKQLIDDYNKKKGGYIIIYDDLSTFKNNQFSDKEKVIKKGGSVKAGSNLDYGSAKTITFEAYKKECAEFRDYLTRNIDTIKKVTSTFDAISSKLMDSKDTSKELDDRKQIIADLLVATSKMNNSYMTLFKVVDKGFVDVLAAVSDGPTNKKEMTKKIEEKGDYNF